MYAKHAVCGDQDARATELIAWHLGYPDDAKLHLGIAYLFAKQPAKAKEVLGSVKSANGAHDLAQLWLIQAGMR
jgi:hypothetical protein